MNVFDRLATRYVRTLKQASVLSLSSVNFFSRIKLETLKSVWLDRPNSCKILDFGCGVGLNIQPLVQGFCAESIAGVDSSSQSIKEASSCNMEIDFYIDLSQVEKKKLRFDLIFCACVFHHIESEEREDVLERLKRLLTPNGIIAVFEHNPFNPLTRLSVALCELDRGVRLLSRRDLMELGDKVDLRVEESLYYMFFPESLYAIEKRFQFLRSIPFGAQYLTIFKAR